MAERFLELTIKASVAIDDTDDEFSIAEKKLSFRSIVHVIKSATADGIELTYGFNDTIYQEGHTQPATDREKIFKRTKAEIAAEDSHGLTIDQAKEGRKLYGTDIAKTLAHFFPPSIYEQPGAAQEGAE